MIETIIPTLARATTFNAPAGFNEETARLFGGWARNDARTLAEFFGPVRMGNMAFSNEVIAPLKDAYGNDVLHIPTDVKAHLASFLKKLAKAIYYMHSGRIFPATGDIHIVTVSNAQVGEAVEQTLSRGAFPKKPALKRSSGSKSLPPISNQFDYSYLIDENGNGGMIVRLHDAFLSGIFISPDNSLALPAIADPE